MDVRWGYNNIRIKEGNEWKAAFLTPKGLFEPTVMFFGLTNSPATFQMMMNTIFHTEVAQGWLSVYMDDIAIHTKQENGKMEQQHLEQHRLYTHHMLHKLEQNNLYLKPKKCDFEKKEIDYLGVIVGNGKIQMDPKKLKGIADWPTPKNPTEICKFLGFTGYYQYFIQGYSKIARPLLDLTKKAMVWNWGEQQQKAFEELKHTCVHDLSSHNQTSTNHSSFKWTHQLMAWVPYSRKRVNTMQPPPKNLNYTQLHTTPQPSHPPSETTTSMSENSLQ